jgi:integrase/recombinase XerD
MQTAKKSSTWKESALSEFSQSLRVSKTQETVQAYSSDVQKFLDYAEALGVKRVSKIRADHVTSYLTLCKKDKSEASICRYYMSLRSFSRFLRKGGCEDFMESVQAPLQRSKAPKIMTLEEVDKLLEAPDTSTEIGTRDRAILEVLYSSGLRASELCDLQLYDVNASSVRVSCGKRGKTRTVPMTHSAWQWVQEYITKYRGIEEGPLFLTCMGRAMRRQLLCKTITSYAKRVGLKDVTTHTLRHACATHLLEHGADIRLIQSVLGHASITSTERYTHLSSAKINSMFGQFHPRNNSQCLHTSG